MIDHFWFTKKEWLTLENGDMSSGAVWEDAKNESTETCKRLDAFVYEWF